MSRDSDLVKADVKVIVKLDDGKVTPPFAFARGMFVSRRELDEVMGYNAMQREAEKEGKPVAITTWEKIRNAANYVMRQCHFTTEDMVCDAKSSRPTRARSSTAS